MNDGMWRKLLFVLTILPLQQAVVATQANEFARPTYVGNPFAVVWPHESYPRNIWDMAVFEDRLFFGTGNSANVAPAPNAGPVPLISMDSTGTFFQETIVADEQIEQFRVLNDQLMVPGHDATESWAWGNVYRRLSADGWRKERIIPRGVHVYDLLESDDALFAVGGSDQPVVAWVSENSGKSWRPLELAAAARIDGANPSGLEGPPIRLLGGRLYRIFELNGSVFASGQVGLSLDDGGKGIAIAVVFQLDPEAGLWPVEYVTLPSTLKTVENALYSLDLIHEPAIANPGGRYALPSIMIRKVETVGDMIVYITGFPHNGHQWKPVDLMVATSRDETQTIAGTVQQLEEGFLPLDLVVRNGAVHVLLSRRLSQSTYLVRVVKASNLFDPEWTCQVEFPAPSPARSFEIFDGHYFFGLRMWTKVTTAFSPGFVNAYDLDLTGGVAPGDILKIPLPTNGGACH